jgi:hypothetical protein
MCHRSVNRSDGSIALRTSADRGAVPTVESVHVVCAPTCLNELERKTLPPQRTESHRLSEIHPPHFGPTTTKRCEWAGNALADFVTLLLAAQRRWGAHAD